MDTNDELRNAIKALIGINSDKYYTITRCQNFEGSSGSFGLRA